MRSTRILAATLFVLILPAFAQGLVQSQAGDSQFFPETGHIVQGEFLAFYNSASDPKLVFGYPITEQMTSRDGMTVQYFQRARFELAADASGAPRVQLTPLGQALYRPGEPRTVLNLQACQFSQNTGFPVCMQFLDFYLAHGGLEQFGIPISPLEMHNGILVQYFEKARLEWRADGFSGRIVPADLGRIYFDALGEDPAQRSPIGPADAAIDPVLSVRIQAYVARAVTLPTGDQTLFVIARDQTNRTIANASGRASMTFPDGTTQTFNFTTNSLGTAQVSFGFTNQKAGGMVLIEVSAAYQNLDATTRTSFRIWL